ncbi:MAG: sodium-extruding oxaloacetate decarboxylase subunit alpha [Thermodesulfobacteriota bacterium]|nr:sodium-extruding oxaloacetate decarboxylase subunit alpha [Thermodesulfobacteriota bacterium]
MKDTNPVQFTDLTLRDAHQSLLATRMKTEDMLPVAEYIDNIGYWSLEMWGGATFDSCIRFLREDPWERINTLKKAMPKTKFQMLLRGQNCVGYRHYADDVVREFVQLAAERGIDVFRIFDALNDFRNLETAVKATKDAGKIAEGTICYTISPVHNIANFVKQGIELDAMGSDTVCIKDMAGLLSPLDAYKLVSELKAKVKVPIHLHCHSTSGMGSMTYLKAIEADVDIIDTCISSLSLGTAHPPVEVMEYILRKHPRAPKLKTENFGSIARYFKELRNKPFYKQFDKQVGSSVDIGILESQIPGGMMSNMLKQLEEQKQAHRLDEVLKETPLTRKDVGYVPLVTPTSQIVGTQAVINIMMDERYKNITSETKNLVLGKYGKTPAPISEDLLKKVMEITGEVPITHRPADDLQPELERLRQETIKLSGVNKEERGLREDTITCALFPQVAPEFFQIRAQKRAGTHKEKEVPVEKKKETVEEGALTKPVSQVSGPMVYKVLVEGHNYFVEIQEVGATVTSQITQTSPPVIKELPKEAVNGTAIKAPMLGNIIKIMVDQGTEVNKDDTLFILESMKMENEIKATSSGTISQILVSAGAEVQANQVLCVIEQDK